MLLDTDGTVKLCDFGISGRLVDSKAKTRSAGCAAYMAVSVYFLFFLLWFLRQSQDWMDKLESVTFYKVLVLVSNPECFIGKVSIKDGLPQSLFQNIISKNWKLSFSLNPADTNLNTFTPDHFWARGNLFALTSLKNHRKHDQNTT